MEISQQLFEYLNLDSPGLETVRLALNRDDIPGAQEAYLRFRRFRDYPKWHFDWKESSKRRGCKEVDYAKNVMNHFIGGYVGEPAYVGDPINWDFNPVDPSSPDFTNEWTWCNLNRFHFWVVLGRAYWETGNEDYALEWVRQMRHWVMTSPVPLDDPNYGNRSLRWRTIEAGIRSSTTWMDAYHYFLNSPSFTPETHAVMVKSFMDHAHHLERITVEQPQRSGNWVTMECNGLATIAIMFPEFNDSPRWLGIALNRLYEELIRQVYPDGAQIELTTSYHQVALQNFVAVAHLARLNRVELPRDYIARLGKMYEFNLYMMMPNGELPGLNDASPTRVSESLAEAYRLYGKGEYLFGATYGKEGRKPAHDSYAFRCAGYYIMRSGWDKDDRYLLFDAGPFGYGHQHEDKLNIVAYAYGDMVLTEPGNYVYDQSKWRRYVLSTSAHNTALVDGMGQNRRARKETYIADAPNRNPWVVTPVFDYVSGRYEDGYGPHNDMSVAHSRSVIFIRPDYWMVVDRFEGEGSHRIQVHYHLNADNAGVWQGRGVCSRRPNGPNLLIMPVGSSPVSVEVIKGQEDPVLGWVPQWRKEDGGEGFVRRPIPTVVFSLETQLPVTLPVILYPFPREAKPIHIREIEMEGACGCVIDARDLILVEYGPAGSRPRRLEWVGGEISFRAELLIGRIQGEEVRYGAVGLYSFKSGDLSIAPPEPVAINFSVRRE